MHLHLPDGFDDDALERAAPAGMNGGDGALFRVHEEQGDAVCSLDGQEKAGTVGGGGVALTRFSGCGVEKMDDIRMNLLQGDEFEVGRADGGLEVAAVFEDVFSGVPLGET